MPIIRTHSFIEVYRARAQSKDINAMSGRANAKLTDHIAHNIVRSLKLTTTDTLVDVGCGQGSVLVTASGQITAPGQLIGILPTQEEATRARHHLAQKNPRITILVGLADKTGLSDHTADKVVCNGVFLILPPETILKVLAELSRITKPGGTILIGELPDCNEWDRVAAQTVALTPLPSKSATLLFRALHILKSEGLSGVMSRLHNRLKTSLQGLSQRFGEEPIIIGPKMTFWMAPQDFCRMLEQNGYHSVQCFRHEEFNAAGEVTLSATRWNFLAIRT